MKLLHTAAIFVVLAVAVRAQTVDIDGGDDIDAPGGSLDDDGIGGDGCPEASATLQLDSTLTTTVLCGETKYIEFDLSTYADPPSEISFTFTNNGHPDGEIGNDGLELVNYAESRCPTRSEPNNLGMSFFWEGDVETVSWPAIGEPSFTQKKYFIGLYHEEDAGSSFCSSVFEERPKAVSVTISTGNSGGGTFSGDPTTAIMSMMIFMCIIICICICVCVCITGMSKGGGRSYRNPLYSNRMANTGGFGPQFGGGYGGGSGFGRSPFGGPRF